MRDDDDDVSGLEIVSFMFRNVPAIESTIMYQVVAV
jgi:hypothetical protein